MASQVKCPKCESTQLTANKKGFSGIQAIAGAVVTGGIGLLAGTIGSNKIKITCLACGYQFNPGQNQGLISIMTELKKEQEKTQEKKQKEPFGNPLLIVFFLVALIALIFFLSSL